MYLNGRTAAGPIFRVYFYGRGAADLFLGEYVYGRKYVNLSLIILTLLTLLTLDGRYIKIRLRYSVYTMYQGLFQIQEIQYNSFYGNVSSFRDSGSQKVQHRFGGFKY